MRKILLVAAALVCQAVPLVGQGTGGWWHDLFRVTAVPLEDVARKPEAWLGQTVQCVVQLRALERVDNPYDTRFGPDRYVAVSAWPDETPLWERAPYEAPQRHLFAALGSETAMALEKAPRYSRWELTADVAEIFRGNPWMEIRSARRLPDQIDEPSLVQLVKGFMLGDMKRWDAAATAFRAADHTGLPSWVRTVAMREEGRALHEGGKTDLAVDRLGRALAIGVADAATTELLRQIQASRGRDLDGHPLPAGGPVPITSK